MELPHNPGSKEDCLIPYILKPWVFLNIYEALGSAPSAGNKQITTTTTTTKDSLVGYKIHPVTCSLSQAQGFKRMRQELCRQAFAF